MAAGMTPEQVEAAMDKTLADKDKKDGSNEGDYMMLLFGGAQAAPAPMLVHTCRLAPLGNLSALPTARCSTPQPAQ